MASKVTGDTPDCGGGRRCSPTRCWLTVLLALFIPLSASAQRFAFKYYSHDQGLISLDVHGLIQDRTGYVWVATLDGVFRYDGSRFTGFYTAQGLPSNRIVSIHQSADGTIWVGTLGGLARFQENHFRSVQLSEPVTFLSDSSLASDAKGNLYFGTNHGLWLMRQGSQTAVKLYPQKPSLAHPEVYGVHLNAEGAAWFGCGTELCRYDRGHISMFGTESGIPKDT